MSLITRGADLIYTYRFLRILTTPFEKTRAFELGLIDAEGKRIKSQRKDTPERRSAYTLFHRLVFNIKRLMAKVPGGSSRLASYAAALFLLKETYGLSERSIGLILKECDVTPDDILKENTQWFILEDESLAPGTYRVGNEKVINETFEPLVSPNDQVRVYDDAFPVGNFLGINVYEATHVKTQKTIYVTAGELIK
jgi:hypothetical protein